MLNSFEPTITQSEHAAQLQAACVELRETAATCCAERANDLEEGSHVYAPNIDPFADRRQSCIGELREVAKLIRTIPIPTAALETAIAEARLDEHYCPLCGVLGTDNCARHIELQAALDAAKAKRP